MGLATNHRQTTIVNSGSATTILSGTSGAKRIIQSAWASSDGLTGSDDTSKLRVELNGNFLCAVDVNSVDALAPLFNMVIEPSDTVTAYYDGTVPTGDTFVNISYIEHVE